MAFNFDQGLVLCVQLLLTLLSSTVRQNVADSEFEVYLEVTDDNGDVDLWTYKSDKLDIDLVHERATDLMKSALRRRYRSDQNNATSFVNPEEKPNATPIRKKRQAETSVDCREKSDYMSTVTGVVAEPAQTVSVPCRFCVDSKRETLNAKVWYRFERDNAGGDAIFKAVQVKLDKHDDPKLNRIFVHPDHTLVIFNFQPSDAGAYFCDVYNAKTFGRTQPFSFRIPSVDESSPAAILLGWKVVSGTTGLTFMTIIDIMHPVARVSVSYTLAGFEKPAVPRKNTESNWITYAEWGEWSECSKCGEGGRKTRLGRCMVRKMEVAVASKPTYLDEVLKLYPRGAPCQSSLFTDQTTVEAVNNELEHDACSLPCGADYTQFLSVRLAKHIAGKAVGVFKKVLNPNSNIPTVPPFTQQGIEQEEGTPLKLYCPSIYEDSEVIWKKDRATLKPAEMSLNTSGRVKLDQYLRLVFKYLELEDSGHYACYVDFKATVDYFLAVYPTYVNHGPWKPGIIIIAYWYSGAIFLFLVINIIRHSQRFDNTRARAYRTKLSIRRAKGYHDYKELYGEHGKKPKYKYLVKATNATANANSANNWNSSNDDDDDDDDYVMANLYMAEVNKYVNSTHADKFTAESILIASTSSPENTSFTTTSKSATSEQQSVVESDLESIDLSSSDDEYALLDSSSDWEFSSHYSATGDDSEIPDEPHWMIF